MSFDIFFSSPISFSCTDFEPSPLFLHKFRSVLQLLLESLFLVRKTRTRGVVSRSLRAGIIGGSLRLGGYLFLNNFSTSFFHNFCPKNDPKSEPKSMKNEVEKRTRKRKSKSKKKYQKKTPRRDAKTSKTKQNAERGDDFRKMHISAQ